MNLDILNNKIDLIKALDEDSKVYTFSPVSTEEEVREFEIKFKIRLPEDFRFFLMNVANGILNNIFSVSKVIERIDFENYYYKKDCYNPSIEFPLTERCCSEHSVSDDYPFSCNYSGFNTKESTNGYIDIFNSGSGAFEFIVVNGKEYGNIWLNNDSSNSEILPDYSMNPLIERIDFEFWINKKLDSAIETLKWLDPQKYYGNTIIKCESHKNKPFNILEFWDNENWFFKSIGEILIDEALNDELIKSVEMELGYKLPKFYIELMKIQNGGESHFCYFPTVEYNPCAADYISINIFFRIGYGEDYSLITKFGINSLIENWDLDYKGFCICSNSSVYSEHDFVMLDYKECGKTGEPQVVHVAYQRGERKFKAKVIAKDFETFIRGLEKGDIYFENKIRETIETLERAKFSEILPVFFKYNKNINFEEYLRNVLIKLIGRKRELYLKDDDLSYLVYDILFYLFSKNVRISSKRKFLEDFIKIIDFNNSIIRKFPNFFIKPYNPQYINNWLKKRLLNNDIKEGLFNSLKFTTEYELKLIEQLVEYE